MSPDHRTFVVEVAGGQLTVGEWGPRDGPVVLAVHGVTANHTCWGLLAEQLPGIRLVAPDLRGRGRSAGLPGPWGMAAHTADLAAVVRAAGAGPVVVVGHSMGGFVAVTFAHHHPDLVSDLVLVDGGLPLAGPVDLGPALQRLSHTFASVEDYRDYWRAHPAFREHWSPAVEDYVDYDLVGTAPSLRSGVSAAAVEADSAELHDSDPTGLDRPLHLVTVRRGLLDEPPGLYPPAALSDWQTRLPHLSLETWPDLNHYTVILSTPGAARLARVLRPFTL